MVTNFLITFKHMSKIALKHIIWTFCFPSVNLTQWSVSIIIKDVWLSSLSIWSSSLSALSYRPYLHYHIVLICMFILPICIRFKSWSQPEILQFDRSHITYNTYTNFQSSMKYRASHSPFKIFVRSHLENSTRDVNINLHMWSVLSLIRPIVNNGAYIIKHGWWRLI